jgi:large repetitive protein
MKLGLTTFRRAPISGLTAVTVVTALVLVPVANAYAAVTPLVNQAFTTPTVPNEWYLPPAASGTNDTCLTASATTTQLPIPGCNLATVDASGSGTLRLTPNTGSKVGSTFYQTSLPTSAGLDIKFDTYQYNATSASGADGIGFALTAVDPANPAPPTVTGPVGGSLGYTTTGGNAGIPYGYLGYGADAWGNFANSTFGGSTCALPANLTTGKAYPENLTVRGPGNGTTGYCIMGTTASTYANANTGGSGGTVSNLGGQFLDVKSQTTRPAPVAAEIAMNPTNAAASTASGIVIPANSYLIQVTPYTTATGAATGTPMQLSGLLPTTSNNTVLAGFPSSWINPATGVPYQVSFGWVASTGGSNEIHEVANLVATTLSGMLPVLSVGMSDNENSKFLTSNHADITLSPGVSSAGGDEIDPLTVTDTFPAGIVPGTATSTSLWTCTTVGQKVTCTYAPSTPIPAGTSLPTIDVPVTTSSTAAASLVNTVRIGAIDAAPDATTTYYSVSALGATATASIPYGTANVLGTTGLPANATGTVVFTSGATTLCTVLRASATTCSTGTSLVPGTYPVTATYSGDAAYLGATASTTFTVTKSPTAITASATPASIEWGNSVTLTAGNVPIPATGIITFKSGATTLCSTTLPSLSCITSATLAVASYPVTATYPGDSNYTSSTATTAFTIVTSPTPFTVAATPATVTYGTGTSLAETGLPAGATGTVVYKAGATTLCTETLPATSCTSLSTQGAGTVSVIASYGGDATFAASTASTTYLINKAPTTVVAAATPASTTYGTADTLSDSGLPAAATGTVTFAAGGSTLCVATLPATSCAAPTSLLVAGYSVTATYSGDSNFTGSSDTTTFSVTKAPSPFTASATPGSVAYGTAVTLAESGLAASASGTVTFVAGGVTLCTVTRGTAASCDTSTTLDPGTYNVTATYSGDANHAGATDTTSFVVTKVASPFTAAAAPGSVVHGNTVILSESGLVPGATGTVTFASGGTTLCTATLPATSCGTSTSLAGGAYPVTATYSGDTDHATSTATTSFSVTAESTSFTADATPSTVTYGTAVTLAENGLDPTATGTVSFDSGGTTLCTATLPATSCDTTTTVAVGSYPVTATYSGDGNFAGSAATTSFSVTQLPTAVSASASPASVEFGTPTTLKESGLPGAATGTVTFTTGGTTLCTVTLGSGNTCATPVSLVVGTYPVTATYSGDATHLGSTDTTSFAVTKQTTSFTAGALPSSLQYGNPTTLGENGLPTDATGTVTFTSGGVTLCTLNLATDTTCVTSASLDPAHYPVTATYSGDANHTGSSDTTAFDVVTAPAPFTATATPGSVAYGNAVTLKATSLPVGATGTVTFTSGTTTLCSVNLTSGTSCLTSASLDPAVFPVLATYSGDVDYSSATDTTSFTVTHQPTALAVSATPATVTYGTAVSLVEAGLPAAATGTVTLDWGSAATCTVTLGSATSCSTPATLDPATYPVTGHYSGDADYAASSATSSFVVTKAPSSVVASASPASVAYGTADTLKETGLPADATGSVTFTSGGTTLCTVALGGPNTCATSNVLPAGVYPVTATYAGDSHYTGSTDTATFTVHRAATAITASAAPASVVFGNPDTLTAGNLPTAATGTVTFAHAGTTLCVATIPAVSCATSTTLGTGSYSVDATYSGDSNFAGSSATTSFAVTTAGTALTVGATPSTTTHGNPITLTTGGLPADATGTVTFTSGGSTLCTVNVGVTSTCSTSATLAVGGYPVTGTYSGDANHGGSSDTTSFSITKAGTSLSASATPPSVSYGTSVTLAEGNLPADATGTVTFVSGGTTLCFVDVASAGSCNTSPTLAVATYPVTATYSGDASHNGSSASTSFVVGTAATAVVVTAAPMTAAYGTPVSLTEGSLPAAATGTVTFTSGGTTLCTVVITAASSCSTTSTLAPGAYPVTGTYSGDLHFAGSANTTSFTVTKAASNVTGSGPAPTAYSDPITLSVGGLPTDATGTVTLKSGSLTLCTVTLPGGSCVVSPTLTPATYVVTVDYPGDTDYLGSTDSFSFDVVKAPTGVTASTTPASVSYGDPVTLTPGGLPAGATGTVTFSSGGTTLCTVVLGSATSCLTSTTLTGGTYPVDVTYSGDSNYTGSTTAASFTVGAAATTFTVSASPTVADFGTAVALTPSGLPSGATGTVVMTSGATTLCTVHLATETSCQAPASTPVGSYPVHAAYSGDTNYAGSSATTSFSVVKAAAPFTADATPTPATYGTAVTLSDSGLPSDATGTVTFHQGGTGYCVATLPATSCQTAATLDPGAYPVTASYSGDGSYLASSATTAFTVTKAPVVLTATATPSSTSYGDVVTLTGAGLPATATGSVTFVSGGVTLCTTTLPATSCLTPNTLTPANYPVTATYSGDTDYLGATDTTTFAIGLAATSLTASATPGAIAYGNPVTLTEGGLPASATGTVTFVSGGVTLCVLDITTATGCPTSSSLSAGAYPVTATYSGDSNWAGSVATTAFSVGTAPVALTAVAIPSTATYGNAITLVPSGLPASATGTVTFTSGTAPLCTVTIGADTSCATTATLDSGAYPVTAAYSGDSNHATAVATTSFTITKVPVSIVAAATPGTTPYGQQVILSATGIPAGAIGTVTFASGGVPLCTATLPAISCGAPAGLEPGAFPVDATYSGDLNHTPAGASTSFHVTVATSVFTVQASPPAVPHGTATTLTYAGLPAGATGTVSFSAGGVVLCTAVVGTAASCPTSATLATGDYAVTATYSGDAHFAPETAITGFTVGPVADTFITTGPVRQPQQTAVTTPGGYTITLLDNSGVAATKVVEPGEGTYTLNPKTGVITFTPTPTFYGVASPVRYRITDPAGQSDTGSYHAIVVAPAPPTVPSRSTSGPMNSAQRVVVPVPNGDTIALVDSHGRSVTSLAISGKGTYTLSSKTGVITFMPDSGYTGTVSPATFKVTDPFGQVGAATYTASVYGTHVPPQPVHGAPSPVEPPVNPSTLPFTGFNADRLLLMTAFMIAAGTVLVVTSRHAVTSRLFRRS